MVKGKSQKDKNLRGNNGSVGGKGDRGGLKNQSILPKLAKVFHSWPKYWPKFTFLSRRIADFFAEFPPIQHARR